MKFWNRAARLLLAVMCITAVSFGVSANTSKTISAVTPDLSVNDNIESKTPLTPKGNMTSIDDVHQITDTRDKNSIEEKQFITVQTKNGNVFYIIIDRSGNTENVYFLNAVDDSDLLALLEEEQKAEFTATCNCTDKCEVGKVNENCPVCAKNKDKCEGKEIKAKTEKETETEKKEEPAVKKDKKGSPLVGMLIIAILGAGGALYWFKIKGNKPSTKGTSDPSDYEEDEEDSDYETEGDKEDDNEDEADDDDEEPDESEDE